MPVQTYFNTHIEGTSAVAVSPDSKFIASISAQQPQVLAIWEWTTESETPVCSVELDQRYGLQDYIKFNRAVPSQIVTNSAHQALFYEWDAQNGFQFFAPLLNDETFNRPVGKLTQSLYQTQKSRALTGTSLGGLVVWQPIDDKTHICDKKPFKIFKLQERSINVLTNMNEYSNFVYLYEKKLILNFKRFIVIGDADGEIKFIDDNLHVIMWYKHFKLGPINTISFTQTTKDFKPYVEI
jgi:WD40 repeat protein